MAKTPKSIINVLDKLAKDIEEKKEVVDALEIIINADQLKAELDSTNKAIEREIKANTVRLSRLRTSIKNAETQEIKLNDETVANIKVEKEKAQREIKRIKDDVAKKREWREGELAGCNADVKEMKLTANRIEKEVKGNIAELEEKHVKVKNAYEEIKKLANV